jgi:hypothetical protein
MGVTVPEPGNGVFVSTVDVTGQSRSFGVRVADDGTISYPEVGPNLQASSASAEALAAAASPTSCDDGTYKLLGYKEYGTWTWWIGDGGKPAALTVAEAKAAYADAINNMTQTTDTCGYSDEVDAAASYGGTTTVESDMDASGNCLSPDSKSSIDAGNLPTAVVAQTCAYTNSVPLAKDDLAQADIRFNTNDLNFVDGGACTTQFDLRSILTHEVGHVFGLGDITGAHEWLTMAYSGGPCETRKRTLAKGDVLGMRSLY